VVAHAWCFLAFLAIVNQHPPVHHVGWLVSCEETIFSWVLIL
jgi:hypothetical protein